MARKKSQTEKLYNIKLCSELGQEINFPSICKFIREAFQVSQLDMAQRLEVELGSYQQWEYGKREPSSKYAINLYLMYLQTKQETDKKKNEPSKTTENQLQDPLAIAS